MANTLDKLDEDFLFLLGLTQSFSHRLEDTPEHSKRCNAWLEKLCGDPVNGTDKKRIRNTYLSKLILCMQAAELQGVFKEPPPVGDLEDAFDKKETVVEPPWLQSLSTQETTQTTASGISGRTYLATKQFPEGGACAYLAIANGTKPKDWLNMEGGRYDFGRTVDESLDRRFQGIGEESGAAHMRAAGSCQLDDRKAMMAAAITAELHGDVCSGQLEILERAIIQHKNEIAVREPYKIIELNKLSESKLRHFLLTSLLQKLYD